MMRFIICEDKKEALEIAAKTVTKTMMNYDIEYKISKFEKYNKELKEIIKEQFDTKIYILDIEMSIVSGLEIASEIREDDDESIIMFVTAHPECQNDIFYSRLQAVDYISKNEKYTERLQKTIEYVIDKKYNNRAFNFISNHIHYRVLYKEINYIDKCSSLNKSNIHLVDGQTKETTISIAQLKEKLGSAFYQTHKSCLINVNNIKHIDYTNCVIKFKNGDSTTLLALAAKKGLKDRVRNS